MIARRLSFAGKNGRRSPGMAIAVTGLSLSIIIMLVSIAVVTGFKQAIRHKVTGFASSITIAPPTVPNSGTAATITLTDSLLSAIRSVAPKAEVDLTLPQPVLIKTPTDFAGMIVKGIREGATSRFLQENLAEGELPDFDDPEQRNDIAISAHTARHLELNVGDKVDAHFLQGNSVKNRRLKVTAIYDTHFTEYDQLYLFAPIALTQGVCETDSLSGALIELNGLPDSQLDDIATDLRVALWEQEMSSPRPKIYAITSVHESGAIYYNWLALLDTNVVVILLLMGAVAAVTLISSLIIIILERVRLIGILKALGASNRFIRQIFILMTQRLVTRGVVIGNVVGLGLILLQRYTHWLPLDADAYYLDYVPVELSWLAVVGLNVAVIVVSVLVLLGPSHIIATISPSRSMRYE